MRPNFTLQRTLDPAAVKLRNNGIGPLIVTVLSVAREGETRSSVLEWMPHLPDGRAWSTFSHSLSDRTLQAGGEVTLLELSGDPVEDEGFRYCRDLVRAALTPLIIEVVYTDVYGNELPPRRKNLSWFGRHH